MPGEMLGCETAGVRGETIRLLYVDESSEPTAAELEAAADRFTVHTAASAETALDELQEQSFDCIVSEYELPGMDGVELLETVRELDETMPFVLYTDSGSEAVAAQAVSRDVSEYIIKEDDQYAALADRIVDAVDRQHSTQLTTRALAGARDGVAVFDETGEFQYVNEAYASVYGYEPAELINRGWEQLYPEQEITRYENEVVPRLHAEGGWLGECECLHRDGFRFRSTHSISQLDGGGHICVLHHGSVRSVER